MQGGCATARLEVKKAEVPTEEADILSKLLAEVASASTTPNVFQEPAAAKDLGIGSVNISSNSTFDELLNSPSPFQQGCSNTDSEMVEDERLTKCMDEFDPEAFLNSIDSI